MNLIFEEYKMVCFGKARTKE
ncbi:putative immunity protein PncM [Streptococcus pneumoniae SPNA45]|nr:putative immunity protein PncM [Streptococcus pneumoniae SPNA45]